ncbi:MAG: PDDEXK nuclease domain-containing protein, partial [Muribaculaceae bacterium]|nr:PDDEXK nuclease domain-containing protein [Muribaculaceae bacterium]
KLLPGLRGYGKTQLTEMRLFYEGWSFIDSKSSVATDDLATDNSSVMTDELQYVVNVEDILNIVKIETPIAFPMDDYLKTPFTHHTTLLRKCKNVEERYYYMHRCAEEHMSVPRLEQVIASGEYKVSGKAPNNFIDRIEDKNMARKAVMQFKDSYLLDFINTEEIGERDLQDVDERVVEQKIVHNIKKFIMTFGRDFAFVGNQYHLEIYSEEFFPDLLFFNRELNALVVVELKTGKFKTGYLAQLMTYLRILDDKVRKPHENPSIGIVLCKETNRSFVEYVMQDYDKPMGVATYTTSKEMPDMLKDALPDMDELKKLI